MKNCLAKSVLLLSILFFQPFPHVNAQEINVSDENLENPFSYGLKGIKNINVSASLSYFLFNVEIKSAWVKEIVELGLKANNINVTDVDEMDASLLIEINGTPIGTKEEIIAYSYSITLSLAQDVFLARKKKQFLTGARTWTKTVANYALKQNLRSSLSSDINDLVEQFVTSYYQAN